MPKSSLALVKCTQKLIILNFPCISLATSIAQVSSRSLALSHLVKTIMNYFCICSSILMSIPSVSLKPCITSIKIRIIWLSPLGVCFRQYSISLLHCRISYFDASLAYPQPGASTKRVGRVDLIFRKANYLVFPGFLLVSTNSLLISLLTSVLLPTLLLPKNTNSCISSLQGIVFLMLSILQTACSPVTVNWLNA